MQLSKQPASAARISCAKEQKSRCLHHTHWMLLNNASNQHGANSVTGAQPQLSRIIFLTFSITCSFTIPWILAIVSFQTYNSDLHLSLEHIFIGRHNCFRNANKTIPGARSSACSLFKYPIIVYLRCSLWSLTSGQAIAKTFNTWISLLITFAGPF